MSTKGSKSSYELSTYDKFWLNTNKCGDFIVMAIGFVENTNDKLILNKQTCNKALDYLQIRHPFLRSYIDKQTNCLVVQQNDDDYNPIELDYSDNLISYSDLIKELEIFNSKLFDFEYKSNLSRCKVTSFLNENNSKMYSINLSVSLIITDGINITTVLIELINIINGLLTNKQCKEMIETLEPCESLSYMVDKYSMLNDDKKQKLNELNKKKPVEFLLPKEFRIHNESGFKLSLLKLDQNLTSKIIIKSKENKLRITGYLTSVFIYALRDLYVENGLIFPSDISCLMAANLRIRYNPNMSFSHMRMHVCGVDVGCKNQDFNDLKQFWIVSKLIHDSITDNCDVDNVNLYAFSANEDILRKYNEIFDQGKTIEEKCILANKELHTDFSVSNIGTYVSNQNMVFEGPIKIRETYFTDSLQSKPHVLPAIVFHVSNWDNQICIQLSTNKYAINSIFVDRYMKLIMDKIHQTLA